MAEKRRVTGLLIMTELPNYGLVAVLQRRGEFNHEKMGPESFPGAMQLTVWGGVEESESMPGALFREIQEEMGVATLYKVCDRGGILLPEKYRHLIKNPNFRDRELGENFDTAVEVERDNPSEDKLETLREIYRFEDEKNLKVAYAVKLPCEFLKNICLGPSSGGIRLLKEEEIEKIQDLKNFDKKVGVTDRNILAMFADTKETIQRAFTLLRK